ncbi:hypothetical protein SAMN03080617_02262 [Algoriphagus alkaliphilus]|uniref:Dolichyl-phosphate-mannose-protein mannosyltransferase n=1 Tax=Algoriphagus alkaliphilus TaxID=279824 RepID=A0A1G5Y6Y8_9BACT|nr:hypothetical protein [Algoriphagus alkaliphilus]SDA77847.1 hypothetical protein SAMN03080617_02262 [Algoriphagus alkaliphilus]
MIDTALAGKVLKPTALIYSLLAALYWIFFLSPGDGDEGLMALYLDESKIKGFYWLIQAGNFSIPFSLLAYPLSLLFPSYLALRFSSLLGAVFLYFYLDKALNFKSKNFRIHLLFYLSSGSFLLGTNDNLLFCLLTVFFTEVYLVLVKRQERVPRYALISMVTALFTRQMAVIYLPVILAGLFLVYFRKKIFWKEYQAIIVSSLFWFGLNLPSIQANGFISFDNKDTKSQLGMTWVQRQYLSQLSANEGEIPQFSHVTWEETYKYVQENGQESLPRTSLEALVFDPILTLKEFIKDFGFMIYSGFRQCGLAVFFPVLGIWLFFKSGNKGIGYLSLSQLFLMLAISFIIISYVEIRWLAPVFIMGLIGLQESIRSKQVPVQMDLINQLTLLALSLYGFYRYVTLIQNTEVFQSFL